MLQTRVVVVHRLVRKDSLPQVLNQLVAGVVGPPRAKPVVVSFTTR